MTFYNILHNSLFIIHHFKIFSTNFKILQNLAKSCKILQISVLLFDICIFHFLSKFDILTFQIVQIIKKY